MNVTATIRKTQTIVYDIPEKWASEFESVETAFPNGIPASVVRSFARSKGFKLNTIDE